MMHRILPMLTILLSAILINTAVANQNPNPIKIVSYAETKIKVEENGKQIEKTVKADKIIPGQTIQYITVYENTGDKAVDGVNVINPIPTQLIYAMSTAWGENSDVSHSIDGGKAWGTLASLKKKDKDGKPVAVTASDITHIRWRNKGALKPGEKRMVGFQVTLRE